MGRRAQHTSEQLRTMIINAARQIIENRGVAKLTARQIALRIGYSPGSIYNQFSSINEILFVIQADLLSEVGEALRAVPRSDCPHTYVDALAQAYLAFALRNRHLWNLLIVRTPAGADESLAALHEQINLNMQLIERAMKPLLPANANGQDLMLSTRALWAGLHGVTTIAVTGIAPNITTKSAQQFARALTTTFLAGLAKSTATAN